MCSFILVCPSIGVGVDVLGACFTLTVVSSYDVQTNVSVRGTSIHNIHKGEVLFFSSLYI